MDTSVRQQQQVVILGAGLAGLTAGYVLTESGLSVRLIERESQVGGLARTVVCDDFRFDLGGHRFKTDNDRISQIVSTLLGKQMLTVQRASKILLGQHYINYPLRPLNAMFALGLKTATRIITDYARQQFHKNRALETDTSLQDWVIRKFGRALFEIYFRDYSEKVWGIECQRISSAWVEQRIHGLSLWVAIREALFRSGESGLRTLAGEFLYPSRGISQMAEALQTAIERRGRIDTGRRIAGIKHRAGRITSITVEHRGRRTSLGGDEFISSLPLATMVKLLRPKPPLHVLSAANKLRYRDLVVVTVMIDRNRVTDQSWIYIPDPDIPFGRIHEPTNWSPNMAPSGKTLLVTEHFCFQGDRTWCADERTLTDKTVTALEALGLISRREVITSKVVRVAKAYPLFEIGYAAHCGVLESYLSQFANLHLIGRSGLFRYYNMDHTMESGMQIADQIAARAKVAPAAARQEFVYAG